MIHYIVSGYGRSGTSMMMRCLEMGGMKCHYNQQQPTITKMNKYGSYEVEREESATQEAFETKWASMYEHPGLCIKIDMIKIEYMPDDNRIFYIVFMLRNPKSIYASLIHQIYDEKHHDLKRIEDPDKYYKLIGQRIYQLEHMENVNLHLMDYDRVIEHPFAEFTRLKQTGWPINICRASAGVEPQERKF